MSVPHAPMKPYGATVIQTIDRGIRKCLAMKVCAMLDSPFACR